MAPRTGIEPVSAEPESATLSVRPPGHILGTHSNILILLFASTCYSLSHATIIIHPSLIKANSSFSLAVFYYQPFTITVLHYGSFSLAIFYNGSFTIAVFYYNAAYTFTLFSL